MARVRAPPVGFVPPRMKGGRPIGFDGSDCPGVSCWAAQHLAHAGESARLARAERPAGPNGSPSAQYEQ